MHLARTTTPTITAALAASSATPSLSAVINDTLDRPHASLTNSHSGRSAIIQLTPTSWLRAYVSQPSLGSNAELYTQLFTDPSDATQLNTWNSRTSTAAGQAGVALAILDSTIFLFYQRQSDNHICYQTSTDGAGWSAEAVASSGTYRVWALASSGHNDLFIAGDAVPGNDASQDITLLTYTGSWSVSATWTNPAVQISGMSAVYDGSTYRIALGAQSRPGGALALCTLTYNGTSWSPVTPIHPIDDPLTGLSSPYPSLTLIGSTYRIASTLYDSGSATGSAGNRTELWTSPDFVHWRLEQVLGTSLTNGANICPGANGLGWLIADGGTLVRSDASDSTSNPPIDISDRLHAIRILEPANDTTTAVATLDNHDGALTPTYPPTTALRIGAQLQLSLGYSNSNVLTHSLYIDRIEQLNAEVDGAETAAIVLHLSSRSRRMENTVHTDRVYSGATLAFLVAEVAIAGGMPATPTSPGTTQFSQTIDSFTTAAPSTFRDAINRLSQVYGFDWFTDENDQLQLREPQATDAPSASYGTGTVQTIGHSLTPTRQPNHIRVTGKGTAGAAPPFADAFRFSTTETTAEPVHHRATDRLLDTAAKCAIRAGIEMRKAERQSIDGRAHLTLDPAHQPLDVITIADESLTTTARVAAIEWLIDMPANTFQQLATLEAP